MFYDVFFEKLYHNNVKYLLIGGYAVNIYGVNRATCDIDILVDLSPENIDNLLNVLKSIDMIPQLPVNIEDIKSEKIRNQWTKEKNLIAFSFYKKNEPYHAVDVFLKQLANFEELFHNRKIIKYNDVEIYVISKEDLIKLKSISGRKKDNLDIEELKK